MVSSNKKGGKLVPDSQFTFFTRYHHLKVSKLDDSVVDLLRFNEKISYQTKGGWWSSKKARVGKDDGASENYVGRKFIDELKRQGAAVAEIPDQEITHCSFRRKLLKWRFRFEERREGVATAR